MSTTRQVPGHPEAQVGRRELLLGGGLVLAVSLSGSATLAAVLADRPKGKASLAGVQDIVDTGGPLRAFAPNAFIRITPANEIFLILPNVEMGQGISTGEVMMLAEELEVGMDQVHVLESPPNDQLYGSPLFPVQNTGGSMSTMGTWEQLRTAGAAARVMLIQAAAQRWHVAPADCHAVRGMIRHAASGRSLPYGDVADAAALLPVPKHVELKVPGQFTLIGRGAARIDAPAKINGRLKYGIDLRLPGMKVAAIRACPYRGGTLVAIDDKLTRRVPGVVQVVRLDSAVAVVAEHFWAAKRGADELEIQWNPGANGDLDSAALWTQLEQICRQGPAPVAFAQGNVEQAMARAAVRVEAEYHQPFLSHAPMEPPSAVVHVRKGRTELWTGTQAPTRVRAHVAAFLGIPEAEIILHNVPIGGSFGRRLETDYVLEAVAVARACSFPVKLVWTREDDIQRDNLRPMYVDRISAGLDRTGMPVAWKHRIASASVIARYFPDLLRPNGVDFDTVVSAEDPVYGKFPNMLVEHVRPKWPPELVVSTVRGSGAAANQFVMESFVDELAHAAKADPLDYRRRLAAGVPRALAVLERVATESGWGKPLPARAGRGVSLQKAFGSFLAVVVEAAVTDDGEVRLQQVTAAVDCGVVVNPNLVRQQLEGGLLFGLSSAMFQEVTFDGGKVQQGNFHDFGTLRMGGSPPVAVHIVPSTEAPGGIGECGSAAAPPALVNALFAATGVRVRSAPIRLARLGRDAAGPG